MHKRIGIAFLIGCVLLTLDAGAEEYNGRFPQAVPASSLPVQRLIVKWRNGATEMTAKPERAAAATAKLGNATGLRLKPLREVVPGMELVALEAPVAGRELADVLARLRADPAIAYVEPDVLRHPHRAPSDALFPNQWFLQSTQPAATRADAAWDVTTGSSGTVVAVLDTGVVYTHPDLKRASQAGKLLPGFDFISADAGGGFAGANDGNGRDSDASDPGDWIDQGDLSRPAFSGRNCTVSPSSWHGTRVSGIIGALTDNGVGVAGEAWQAWILPVRVLGKCGGFDSDILAAMRWAAGLTVVGAPANPYPARIINLSLGADGPCQSTYVDLVEQLSALGVLVVASAGNDGGIVDAPGNCPGVVGVGAIRHVGSKVGFSNLGAGVALSAPGGNCVNTGAGQPCLFSIDTTVDTGTTGPSGPAYTDQFNFNVGTSFSSPIVAGAAALMHSVNARLSPALLALRLEESARAFPTTSPTVPAPPVCHVPTGAGDFQTQECICTTATCGAGMLDTAAAVNDAERPIVDVRLPALVIAGQNVMLDANGSAAACNRRVTTWSWIETPDTGVVINGADQPIATVQAPTSGSFTLRLTITDDQGAQDSRTVTVSSNNATTTALPPLAGNACPTPITVAQDPNPPPNPPPSGGGGGGGGGGLSAVLLAFLAAALCLLRMRRGPRAESREPSE